MVVREHADAARGNSAARNPREVPVTASSLVTPYAETVARLTRFAEDDGAVAGFDGVLVAFTGDDGLRFRAVDFRVDRLAGVTGETVVVRPAA